MACGQYRNDGPALVCNAALGHGAIILAEQLQVVLLERIDQMQGRRTVDKQGRPA
jgi:hypothetical protein